MPLGFEQCRWDVNSAVELKTMPWGYCCWGLTMLLAQSLTTFTVQPSTTLVVHGVYNTRRSIDQQHSFSRGVSTKLSIYYFFPQSSCCSSVIPKYMPVCTVCILCLSKLMPVNIFCQLIYTLIKYLFLLEYLYIVAFCFFIIFMMHKITDAVTSHFLPQAIRSFTAEKFEVNKIIHLYYFYQAQE